MQIILWDADGFSPVLFASYGIRSDEPQMSEFLIVINALQPALAATLLHHCKHLSLSHNSFLQLRARVLTENQGFSRPHKARPTTTLKVVSFTAGSSHFQRVPTIKSSPQINVINSTCNFTNFKGLRQQAHLLTGASWWVQ